MGREDHSGPIDRPVLPRMAFAAPLLLIAFVACFYGNMVPGDFTFDDESILFKAPMMRSGCDTSLSSWVPPRYNTLARERTYRPMVTLTYVLQSRLQRFWYDPGPNHGPEEWLDPLPFKLGNLALHAVAVLLVWLLARRFLDGGPAFFAAALFAVHPATTEAVNGIGFREDILALVFLLAASLFHLRWCGTQARPWSLIGTLACFAGAILSKETAYVFPGLALLMTTGPQPAAASPLLPRKAWGGAAALCVLALATAWLLLVCLRLDMKLSFPWLAGYGKPAWTLAGALLREHLAILFKPWPLVADRFFHAAGQGTPEMIVATTLCVAVAASVLLFVAWRKDGRLLAALAWLLLPLVPVVGLVPLTTPVAERYCYVSCAGVGLLAGWAAQRLSGWFRPAVGPFAQGIRRVRLLPAAAVTLVLAAGVCTAFRNPVWRSQETLWRDTLAWNPRSAKANQNVGVVMLSQGYAGAGIRYLTRACELDPDDWAIAQDLSAAYAMAGNKHMALEVGMKAIRPDFVQPGLMMNIARMHLSAPDPSPGLAERFYMSAIKAGAMRNPSLEQRIAAALAGGAGNGEGAGGRQP